MEGLLLGISVRLRPREIPQSSPASLQPAQSFPPLLLRLTQPFRIKHALPGSITRTRKSRQLFIVPQKLAVSPSGPVFFIFLLYHLLDLFVCFIVSTGQLKILHVTRKDVVCPPLLHASIYIQNRSTRHSFYLTH